MPTSIIASVVGSWVAESLFASIVWRAVVGFLISAVIRSVLSPGTKKKPEDSSNLSAASQDRTQSVRQAITARQVIYGEVRTGGAITYMEAQKSPAAVLYVIITIAGHPVSEIGAVYFNDEIVPTDSSGNATGKYANYVKIFRSLGDEGSPQQPFPYLALNTQNAQWTDAHLQAGCAKILVVLTQNRDLFPQGIPNITAVVKGRKVIDPRRSPTERIYSDNAALCALDYLLDTVYGFGSTYAMEIDDAQVISSANTCDEEVLLAHNAQGVTFDDTNWHISVAEGGRAPRTGEGVRFAPAPSPASSLPGNIIEGTTYYAIRNNDGTFSLASSMANARAGILMPVGGSPVATGEVVMTVYSEPRYTANGVIKTDAKPKEALGILLGAMSGKAVNVGGKWSLFAGAYDTPTVPLDESDLVGNIRVQSLLSRRDSFNGVKGIFTDPNSSWQPTSFPAIASAQYMAEDSGERVWNDIDISGFVTSPSQAQRIAKIALLQARQGLSFVARFRLAAWSAMTGRTVLYSHAKFGWVNKPFEVYSSAFVINNDGTLAVDMTLRETTPTIFDWATSEESAVDPAPNTSLPDLFGGLDITSFTATSGTADLFRGQDGTIVPRVHLRWATPANSFVKEYEVQFERLSSSPTEWIDEPRVTAPKNETYIYGANDGEIINIRMRSVTKFGNGGEWAYIYSHTVVGKTAPPSDVTGFTAVQTGESIVFSVSEVTDADLDLIEIRYGAQGETSFDAMLPVTNILRGITTTSSAVPPGTWTFGAKARDTSGNYSTNMASFDLAVSATGKVSLVSQTYAPFSSGIVALNNMVRHWTGVLVPDSQSLASALGWEVFDQCVPNPYADCYATMPEKDTVASAAARAWGTITAALAPGETAGTAAPEFLFDYRTSGAYDGFESWTVGMATFRYCRAGIHINTSVHGVVVISETQLNVDADAQQENGTLTVDASGSGSVSFTSLFRNTPVLQLTPQGAGAVAASYTSLSSAGFTGNFKTAGVASAGTMSYTATGA